MSAAPGLPARPRGYALALAGAVLAFCASAWPTRLSMVDDAYVSARYALALATGEGLRYNAGQPPIEGYTDFAWVLLMAPGTRLPLHYATWATTWGLGFGALGVLGAAWVARGLAPDRPGRAVAAALFVALLPHYGIASTNGLETTQFLAALLLAAGASLRGRWWAGAAAGSLYLIRPEGLLVGGMLAAWASWRRRDRAPLAGFAAVVVPYFAGRAAWFGAWVPNTWNAQARYGFAQMWAMNEGYLGSAWPVWVGVLPALAASVGWVGVRWRRTSPPVARTADAAVLLLVAVTLAAIALQVFNWMPGLRLLLAPIVLVAIVTVSVFEGPVRVGGAVAAAWLAWLTLGPARTEATDYDRATTVQPDNGGERLGRAIALAAPPGCWLLTRDAGVLPYYAGLGVNVIDIHPFSLTDPTLTGKPFDVDHVLDRDVCVIVSTSRRADGAIEYPEDRAVLHDPRVAGHFTKGAVANQHHNRYFTPWTADGVTLPATP